MKHNQAFLDYRDTLPKYNNCGTIWDIDSFSHAVTLLAPEITVAPGQEWQDNKSRLTLLCSEHGKYQVTPNDYLRDTRDSGCQLCKTQKTIDAAGTLRAPRASEAEKNEARRLYTELGNYAEVARITGRSGEAIRLWCDPVAAERDRESTRRWTNNNRERTRKNARRYKSEFSHGKASNLARGAHRRKLKRGEQEWINELDQLVTVFTPRATGDELAREQEFYLEAERLTKETGVQHHVDHIRPLCHGGEHVWWNLQILTAEENMRKGGKYRPEDQALYALRIALLFDEAQAA